MGITEFLAEYITAFIDKTGYITVFIGMMMESMVFPIPSEAIMPFAGFLVAENKFTFPGVIGISTMGSIVGSMISYYMGRYGGKPFVVRFGKYLLLDQSELDATERFFSRFGIWTIFISRFIPVIRHLISIPAGVAKMSIARFLLFTIVGAGIWNSFLTFCGYFLKQNWQRVMQYSKIVDIVVIVILVLLVALFIYRHIKKRKTINAAG